VARYVPLAVCGILSGHVSPATAAPDASSRVVDTVAPTSAVSVMEFFSPTSSMTLELSRYKLLMVLSQSIVTLPVSAGLLVTTPSSRGDSRTSPLSDPIDLGGADSPRMNNGERKPAIR